jgi:hypothetical protein
LTLSEQADTLIAQAMACDELTPRLRDQIEAFVRQSPENARLLAEFSLLDQMLASSEKEADASAILAMLLEAAEAAQPTIVDLSARQQTERQQQAQKNKERTHISFKQACALAGYLAWEGISQSRVITAAVAAVLLVAVTLVFVFGPETSNDTAASDGLASDTQTDAGNSDSPESLAVVATLTAEHNAQWDRRPGQDLYAGQRFKLTQGFAEITTNRGAIAILEAPATIEFTNSDIALRLHAGKLVGICETDSSKGFTVHTPHMDITDLGTRFGVDATAPGQTRVEVFEGEVEAALTAPVSDQPVRQQLTSGQALAAQAGTGWVPAAYEPNRFVMIIDLQRLRPDFAGTNAVWLRQPPRDLREDKQQAQPLQVFIERQDLLLEQDVVIDFNREHDWNPRAGIARHRVNAGQRVDVYLLHFDKPNGHPAPENFEVDFGRPILGVIGADKTLNQTDRLLGAPETIYEPASDKRIVLLGPRGLNVARPGFEHHADHAAITADGTRLQLRLWGGRPAQSSTMDQVRVIVQAAEPGT